MPKRILILEDEPTAANKLRDILHQNISDIEKIETVQSVNEAVDLLNSSECEFDIGFFDVQLADDLSFSVFDQIDINFPVVFTTAYDQFIQKALEEAAVDYLLKPISVERLKKTLRKLEKLEKHFSNSTKITKPIGGIKNRFLVKKGLDFISVKLENIAYFFTEHKISFLVDNSGTKYIIDQSIADLESQLSSAGFFRLNRKFLAAIDSIEKFKSEEGKILVSLSPPTSEKVYVSKENAPRFKAWITGDLHKVK